MRRYHYGFIAIVILAGSAPYAAVFAEDAPPLKLIQKIELSDIRTGEPEVSADQLAKLADLRDRGVITADEFAREKAKILT